MQRKKFKENWWILSLHFWENVTDFEFYKILAVITYFKLVSFSSLQILQGVRYPLKQNGNHYNLHGDMQGKKFKENWKMK
mgnify:CR=1 FL=1